MRRAADQWLLLAAVLATLVACSSLVGAGVLLSGDGLHRATGEAVARADGTSAEGSADLVTIGVTLEQQEGGASEDTRGIVETITSSASEALAPYPSSMSVWASSPMGYLPGESSRLAYVLDADSATEHAQLTDGRWPEPAGAGAPVEVALPLNTASMLGLVVGDDVRLTVSPVHATLRRRKGRTTRLSACSSPTDRWCGSATSSAARASPPTGTGPPRTGRSSSRREPSSIRTAPSNDSTSSPIPTSRRTPTPWHPSSGRPTASARRSASRSPNARVRSSSARDCRRSTPRRRTRRPSREAACSPWCCSSSCSAARAWEWWAAFSSDAGGARRRFWSIAGQVAGSSSDARASRRASSRSRPR